MIDHKQELIEALKRRSTYEFLGAMQDAAIDELAGALAAEGFGRVFRPQTTFKPGDKVRLTGPAWNQLGEASVTQGDVVEVRYIDPDDGSAVFEDGAGNEWAIFSDVNPEDDFSGEAVE